MRPSRLSLSPRAYRRITFVALLSLAFIIVTGAAVRLTGSGLGCPDWPTCEEGRLIAPLEYHPMIEFVNRTVTGLVSAAVIVAVLGSLLRRPRRRDLTWLSLGLVGGVIGQIVLGGLTVLFELAPPFVMGHFLLSMILLWNAVVLHHRAGEEGPPGSPGDADGSAGRPPPRPRWFGARPSWTRVPVVDRDVLRLVRLVFVAGTLVLLTGTVVTASGPHGGDEDAPRFSFDLPDVARIHGIAVVLLLVLVLAVLWATRTPGAAPLQRTGRTLLAVCVAQAGVGYTQYFTGVPVLLVGVHIVGAVSVWIAVVRLQLAAFEPSPAPEAPPAAVGAGSLQPA